MVEVPIYVELDPIIRDQFYIFKVQLETLEEHLHLLTKQVLRLNIELDNLKNGTSSY